VYIEIDGDGCFVHTLFSLQLASNVVKRGTCLASAQLGAVVVEAAAAIEVLSFLQ
jgi:hypothetical protein